MVVRMDRSNRIVKAGGVGKSYSDKNRETNIEERKVHDCIFIKPYPHRNCPHHV